MTLITRTAASAPSAPRRPAAVLWDMDGTIVDTESHWIAAAVEILTEHGIRPPAAGLDALVGLALTDGATLMRDLGVDLPESELVERWLDRASRMTDAAGLDWRPGARELLEQLRSEGVPLALVTMSYRSYADAVVAALPADTFAVTVTGDEVAHGKPAPDAYLRAARLLGVDPRLCVAVEDSLVGLAAARAAGARVVGVPHHMPLAPADADAVWPTLVGRAPADLATLLP